MNVGSPPDFNSGRDNLARADPGDSARQGPLLLDLCGTNAGQGQRPSLAGQNQARELDFRGRSGCRTQPLRLVRAERKPWSAP